MYMEILVFLQIAMVILMAIFIQKFNVMKKQIDSIMQEVTNYISCVTEELEVENERKIEPPKRLEEAQNRLIQAVLGEYFP